MRQRPKGGCDRTYLAIDFYTAEVDNYDDDDEDRVPDGGVDIVVPEVDQSRRSGKLSRRCDRHGVPEVPSCRDAKCRLDEPGGMTDETPGDGHESRHLPCR